MSSASDEIVDLGTAVAHGFQGMVVYLYKSASQDTGQNDLFKSCLKITNADISVANTLWSIFELVGMFMLILWFLIEINKTTMQMVSDSRVQQLAMPFLKLILGILLLQYGKDIVGDILGLGNNFIDTMLGQGDVSISISGGSTEFYDSILEMNFLSVIGMLLPAAGYWIVSLFAQLMIIYQAISRKINVVLYTGLTPLALGDIFQLDQSNAFRFLKKLGANVLWGGLMIAVLKIGATVTGSVSMAGSGNTNYLMSAFYPLLVPLAEAGIISSCKQICYDAFGC